MFKKMAKSASILCVVVLAGALCAAEAAGADEGSSKPLNVVFIAVDDMRPDLGCYGFEGAHTPNIDALAAGGVLFERAYCQQALCGPSRASLLTGLRPDSSGIHGNHAHYRDLHPDVVTLPQHFMQHGYHTAAFGKINHGVFPEGMAPRWDCMGDAPSWSVPAYRPGPRYYYTEEGITAAQGVFRQRFPDRPIEEWDQFLTFGPATEAAPVGDEVLYDGQVALAAVAEIAARAQRPDEPFFLAVGFIKPHSPYIAPESYFDLHPLDEVSLADNRRSPIGAPAQALHNSGELRRYTDQPGRGVIPDEKQRRVRQAYRACISYIDSQVGLVLEALEEQGLADNTIVVLWSDHGYHLGEQDLWGKTTVFELDARVALMCRVPGATGNSQSSAALVELVDLYPSLAELAGLPVPEQCEGTSFAPLLADPSRQWKQGAYTQRTLGNARGYAVTDGRYRFVQWFAGGDGRGDLLAQELYDHETDPHEMQNIAEDPAHADTVTALETLLQHGEGWRGVRDGLGE